MAGPSAACGLQQLGGLPEPVTPNAYEQSIRYRNDNYDAECFGFQKDGQDLGKEEKENFRKGWTASGINDKIVFRIEGTGIAVQYRKSIHKPAPVARVTVDGDEENAHVLDGNFEEDWGDCLYIDTVAEHLENKLHTVEITVVESKGVVVPFYLVSVIGSQ